MTQPLTARASTGLRGRVRVPGDKSISHRALIFGALSVGETRISGLLEGEDVLATADCLRALGADVTRDDDGTWRVYGVGVGGFKEPETALDMGNSGTGARLMMGAIASTPLTATFVGDASLSSRPMGRVIRPLSQMGAQFSAREGGRLPLTMTGCADPLPISYQPPEPSAQVKSAVLLAGLNAPGETQVIEATPTRDHTERMLKAFGAEVRTETLSGGETMIRLTGQPELKPTNVTVPADPSSAAFPLVAALITEGSEVVLDDVMLNPGRAGLVTTLQEMGGDIDISNQRNEGGEDLCTLTVRSSTLEGIAVPAHRAISMIDEYPILFVAAAFAKGETYMPGLEELRVKESDRLAVMATGLRACGVDLDEEGDSLTIRGTAGDPMPGNATIETHLDHRIGMAFLIAGLNARAGITIDDAAPIATSFPTFVELMQGLGGRIERSNQVPT